MHEDMAATSHSIRLGMSLKTGWAEPGDGEENLTRRNLRLDRSICCSACVGVITRYVSFNESAATAAKQNTQCTNAGWPKWSFPFIKQGHLNVRHIPFQAQLMCSKPTISSSYAICTMAEKKNGTICEHLASVSQWLLQIIVVKWCTVQLRGQQASLFTGLCSSQTCTEWLPSKQRLEDVIDQTLTGSDVVIHRFISWLVTSELQLHAALHILHEVAGLQWAQTQKSPQLF